MTVARGVLRRRLYSATAIGSLPRAVRDRGPYASRGAGGDRADREPPRASRAPHAEHPSTLGAGSEGWRPDRHHCVPATFRCDRPRSAWRRACSLGRRGLDGLERSGTVMPRGALARGIVAGRLSFFDPPSSTVAAAKTGFDEALSTAPLGSAGQAKGRSNGISSPKNHAERGRSFATASSAALPHARVCIGELRAGSRGVEPATSPPAGRGQHALLRFPRSSAGTNAVQVGPEALVPKLRADKGHGRCLDPRVAGALRHPY
jgi:hypothetical protein